MASAMTGFPRTGLARGTRRRTDLDRSARVSLLAGIGFTVSLLIGELAYGTGTERDGAAKVAVVAGSVIAAALAAIVLSRRNKVYRRLHERASRDVDDDGVPDIYQSAPRQDARN